jgi:phosphoheptose isomerase
MQNILDRIKQSFSDSIHVKINAADLLADIIAMASLKVVQCLLDGNKIMSCGNGGSAADAARFSGEMLNRYKQERPGLPAIALTTDMCAITSISNDYSFSDIFAKQVRALGHAGDLLLAITTSGNSANILQAINAAHDKNMHVIILTGGDGGKVPSVLNDDDVEIRAPSSDVARIQETHLLILHSICDIIDFQLFGHGEPIL